jgi:hypothetical protein
MPTTTLTAPETLDHQAAALYDTAAWQQIITNWQHTAPDPAPLAATEATEESQSPATAPGDWRSLLSVPVDQLIATAEAALPVAPPDERPLPGRFGAILPDRVHAWRRIGQPDLRPSQQLVYARHILTSWGWQNQPYRLRDARGARCLCGALLAAHRLGYGSLNTANRSGAWILTELRHSHDWTDLIGPWNRAPGRTAQQAIELITATIRRAAHAGE